MGARQAYLAANAERPWHPTRCRVRARDQRLKNARVENSSMLDRLPRDGFPEITRRRGGNITTALLASSYLRMPSFVMTVL